MQRQGYIVKYKFVIICQFAVALTFNVGYTFTFTIYIHFVCGTGYAYTIQCVENKNWQRYLQVRIKHNILFSIWGVSKNRTIPSNIFKFPSTYIYYLINVHCSLYNVHASCIMIHVYFVFRYSKSVLLVTIGYEYEAIQKTNKQYRHSYIAKYHYKKYIYSECIDILQANIQPD